MKSILFVVFIIFASLFSACEKSGSSTIEGKWSVVSDSTIISGATTSYNIYHGNDADYFVFKNGFLYTKESSQLDTFSYKFSSASTISITQTGVYISAITETGVCMFKDNKVRIDVLPDLNNPGFSYRRIINLKR